MLFDAIHEFKKRMSYRSTKISRARILKPHALELAKPRGTKEYLSSFLNRLSIVNTLKKDPQRLWNWIFLVTLCPLF